MAHKSYEKMELVGTSTNTLEEAINTALADASNLNSELRWFEVKEIRGSVEDEKVAQWQVTVNIGCQLRS